MNNIYPLPVEQQHLEDLEIPGDLENPTVKKILNEIVSSNVHQLFLNTEFIVKQHYNLFEITTVL